MEDDLYWKLEKYARSQQSTAGDSDDDCWVVCDRANADLRLVLSSLKFLIVTSNEAIKESHSLWMKENIEAVSKGDSLLVIVKSPEKNYYRKFRVQFADAAGQSSVERCNNCVEKLLELINVSKMSSDIPQPQHPQPQQPQAEATSCSTGAASNPSHVTIAQLAQRMFTGGLPEAYFEVVRSVRDEDVAAMLPLCLSDSNFASFVGRVEQQLKDLIDSDD